MSARTPQATCGGPRKGLRFVGGSCNPNARRKLMKTAGLRRRPSGSLREEAFAVALCREPDSSIQTVLEVSASTTWKRAPILFDQAQAVRPRLVVYIWRPLF